jgi:NAD(P)-dependent dehydrogenase (short-subunit alcohol dehydrogenase family)
MIVANGGKVAIFDLNEDLAKQTASELGAAKAYQVNVTDDESVATAVQQVKNDFGTIHINVNCAGIGAAARTVGKDGALDLKRFNFVIQVNLVGTFSVLSKCAAVMQENEPEGEALERGVVINTASVAAFDGQIGQAAYAASKAGVAGMTLPVARDLSRQGVRVCTIAPGIFDTPMMAGAPDSVRDPLIAMVQYPKRLGLPPEYAQLSRQIVENSYLNGETIRLDGGIRMAAK